MSVRKTCYNCKYYKQGFCEYNEKGGAACKTTEMEYWELSDRCKADLLHDAELEHDAVNSPEHYTSGGIECIDCIKAALGENFMGFLIGNVIKYSYRYKDKNGVEDLKKARWYIDRAINELENGDDVYVRKHY